MRMPTFSLSTFLPPVSVKCLPEDRKKGMLYLIKQAPFSFEDLLHLPRIKVNRTAVSIDTHVDLDPPVIYLNQARGPAPKTVVLMGLPVRSVTFFAYFNSQLLKLFFVLF